jgi:hypothetical protein
MRGVYYVDIDGVEALDEIIRLIEFKGKSVYVTSVNPLIERMVGESEAYRALKARGHVFEKSSGALRYLGFALGEELQGK